MGLLPHALRYFLLFNPAFGPSRGWGSLTPFILLMASQKFISLKKTHDGNDAIVVVPEDKIPIDPPRRTSQPIRISYRRRRRRSRCRRQRLSWSRWTGLSTPSSRSCTAALLRLRIGSIRRNVRPTTAPRHLRHARGRNDWCQRWHRRRRQLT